jgi:hypothetical protein
VAKRKTVTKPARTPVAPPPIVERLQNSGMMRFGEAQLSPSVTLAARTQKPTGRKVAAARAPTVTPTQTSGMARMGDMLSQSPADLAAMMAKPTARKSAGKKGRPK